MPRRLYFQELGLILVIVLISILLAVFGGSTRMRTDAGIVEVNKYLRADNLVQLAKNTSFFAIMAVGMALVIISGGIDLSVGSIYALAAVCGAMVLHRYGPLGARSNTSPAVAVALGISTCVLVGAICGLVNGVLIVLLRVHPFIITLGTMAAYRGIAFVVPSWFTAEDEVSIGQAITDFPVAFTDNLIRLEMGKGLYPIPMIIMIAVAVAGTWTLKKTIFGRRVFAIGSNELASRFCGVPVGATKIIIYTIAGATCGVAAMIMLGYYGSASSDAGNGYELGVIASAVVGGASLQGGRGSAIGALLGALILQQIYNAIIILGINQNYSQIIIGGVIVIAVVLDRLNTQFISRRAVSATGG